MPAPSAFERLACLRPELPAVTSFTVSELPHVAKLDQNESAVDLPEDFKRELARVLAGTGWNRYPQPREYQAARAALADALGVPHGCVALTVGGDQVIQAAFLLAGGAGRRARWFEPTYPYVPLAARVTGTAGDVVVLGPDVDARLDAAAVRGDGTHVDLLVLVSPNNPTGGVVGRAAVEAALEDESCLVLVDEAYVDFANAPSWIDEATRRPNLIVGRSLSKSMCAAVRLGFAVAHPQIIATIDRIYTAPYHLNALQLRVAERYGDILPFVRSAAAVVRSERERVRAALAKIAGVSARPSEGNFVFFALPGASAVQAKLARAGVRVRDVSGLPGAGEALRVTIGTREENDTFLARLAESLQM